MTYSCIDLTAWPEKTKEPKWSKFHKIMVDGYYPYVWELAETSNSVTVMGRFKSFYEAVIWLQRNRGNYEY